MIKFNPVKSKHQLKSMSATVYKMADGTEVLKSYDTIVAMHLMDGTVAFSRYWTSPDGSNTTKRHITTWCGRDIKTVRAGIMKGIFWTFAELDNDYLRAIEVATGGRIG